MRSEIGQSTSGIGTYVALGIGIFTIVLLFFVFAIASSDLQTISDSDSGSLLNESLTLVSTPGNQTSAPSTTTLASVVVTNSSSGVLVTSGNYTVVNNVITAIIGQYYGILNITSGLVQSPSLSYRTNTNAPYNVSSSPLNWNSTNWWDLPLSSKGEIFVTFSPNATHYITTTPTPIQPSTNGTIAGYVFHGVLASDGSKNYTFVISQGHYITNQSGNVYTENCAGSQNLINTLLPGIVGTNVTCRNFKYALYQNDSNGNYTTSALSNFTNAGAVTVVANTTYNSTAPYIMFNPNGGVSGYYTNLTFFTYNNIVYNHNLSDIGGPNNSSYFIYGNNFPVIVSNDSSFVSGINGSVSINAFLVNLTGSGNDGYSTLFVSDDQASSCAELNVTLAIPLESCILMINNFYTASGASQSYVTTLSSMNNTRSSYLNQIVNVSATYSNMIASDGSAILGNYTEALSQQSSQPGVWLTMAGIVVIVSILAVVFFIIPRFSGGGSS